MSLDVTLTGEPREVPCMCPDCFHEHTRTERAEYFTANVTHNLNDMAREAGIYQHLWRPEELGITKAAELIESLRKGLDLLKSDPERFKRHNPENGWGSYDGFVPWVARYLAACEANPTATIGVSR